jgi:hypothetical protein
VARPIDVYCPECSELVGRDYPVERNEYWGDTPGYFEADNSDVVRDEFGQAFCSEDCRAEYHNEKED